MTLLNVVPIEKRTTIRAMASALGIGHSQEEEEPYRCVQNKNFIGNVMFIAAIARPQSSCTGEVLWDGKGVFPFTKTYYALKRSENRPAGTPQLREITKVTRDVIREKLINEVLPAIRLKWLANGVKDIWIQQDNAKPHILTNNQAFNEEDNKDGFNIRLVCQPASSPNMNILDLGLFSALQSIQFKSFPKDLKDLIKVLKARGGNNYKNPHIGKQ
ncbi:uncharacterized protein LOC130824830 [Amaranthus tricolor]|uniref:uncharacterized protein LOC130824830 n=1 Tax=Amaranthus tricolor TaxID=29722 RepID=UPI00258DA3E9|nr:uncharacterized protein LOC130824830 [Amaranthus tricolor]